MKLGLVQAKPPRRRQAGAAAISLAVAAAGASAATKLVRMRRHAQDERSGRYRLYADEPAADGVRRIARGQIDLASERLDGARGAELDRAVHDSRKAFKRMRALLRLARLELGDEIYRRENTTFREAGRQLSATRDARVMAETLDALVARYADELPPGCFDGLRAALNGEADAARKRLQDNPTSVKALVATLANARLRAVAWQLPEDAGIEMLAPGFERIYSRGRRALAVARKDPTAESLHELRKRAKDLWHAAQVLRPAAPELMRELADRAHALADVIGEDHDLAVLLEGGTARAGKLKPGELELLRALVGRRRARLGGEALRNAAGIYRRKPAKLAAKVARAG